jgi:hypothetical protein
MLAVQIGATMCVFAATGHLVCSTVDNAIGESTPLTSTVGLSSVAIGILGIVIAALGIIWS